jgi:hypothetical protein
MIEESGKMEMKWKEGRREDTYSLKSVSLFIHEKPTIKSNLNLVQMRDRVSLKLDEMCLKSS